MSEPRTPDWIAGFEAARKAAITAISVIQPSGDAQERYQRLAAASINALVSLEAEGMVSPQRDAGTLKRYQELKERVRPQEAPPQHWAEREPGSDEEDAP